MSTDFPREAPDPGRTAPGVRASNADRERVTTILSQAAVDGLLSVDEADERIAAAYAATYVRDLRPLTADLPGQTGGDRPGGSQRPAWAGSWPARRAVVIAAIAALFLVPWVHAVVDGPGPHFFPFFPVIPIAVFLMVRFGFFGLRPPWVRRTAPADRRPRR